MCDHTFSRRQLLCGVVLAGTAGGAGCLGEEDTATDIPEPAELPDEQTCAVCGMVIRGSYGPNGQVVYDGDYPPDHDGPAYYDSVRELYVDQFGQKNQGVDPLVAYVTDYASVAYEIETQDGNEYVTGSVDPETFIKAESATFVVESDIRGAMGAELLPFGEHEAAESFAERNGGQVVAAEELTQEVVESL